MEKETVIKIEKGYSSFAEEIKKDYGVSVADCYQCGKCTAGCPVACEADVSPSQAVRMVQLGMRDDLLRAKSVWLCTGCETCATRCPNGVSPAKIFDACRQIGVKEDVPASVPETKIMHEEILRQVSWYGRTHELGMEMLYKFRTKHFKDDMFQGLRMMLGGKISILPGRIKRPSEVAKLIKKEKSE